MMVFTESNFHGSRFRLSSGAWSLSRLSSKGYDSDKIDCFEGSLRIFIDKTDEASCEGTLEQDCPVGKICNGASNPICQGQ